MAEIVLRIALPPPVVWKYPQESYIYDQEIGHWLHPGQQSFTHDKAVTINSVGIRDAEYATNAPKGVYRILALGDSQTFGNGLELADTWPKQLERVLNQNNGGIKYEVLNCGLPGSDTWQHEIILRRLLIEYHPDAVVLAFYVNDVVKSFVPNPDHQLTSNTLKSRFGYLLKRSAFLMVLRTTFNSIQRMMSPDESFLQHQALLKGESNPEFNERWDQVNHSLGSMKKTIDIYSGNFIVASLPRRDQIGGSMPAEAFNKRLQMIVGGHQIPFINMLDPLQQSFKEHGKGLFIPWDGHNTVIANRVIAQEMAGALLASRTTEQ